MYSIDWICKECGEQIINAAYKSYAACPQTIPCLKCKSHMIKNWTVAPNMEIKENSDPVSAKPSSYWRNAEQNKRNKVKKSQNESAEKVFYGDPENRKKQQNRAKNLESNNDPE